jgi:murein DD-endopeptidase MepM/ murein hydrolase activator NlpD
MQRNLYLSLRRWGASTVLVVTMAGTGCSTYQPLDGGSTVPWARALRAASEGESGRVSEAQLVRLPGQRHRVMPGDQLSKLALRYGVTTETLAAANDIPPPYIIYAGDLLVIPEARQARPANPPAGQRYVVQRGESLSAIAGRLNVSIAELAALNRLTPPYALYAGQTLHLPEVAHPAPGAVAQAAPQAPAGAPPKEAVVAAVRQTSPAQETPPATSTKALQSVRAAPPPLTEDGFLWPVNGKVIGGFGVDARGERRDGINIAARKGTPVLAAQDGVVVYAGDAIRGYGRMVLVRHADGYVTTYAHNSALLVEVGEVVRRGQVIARVGDTGDVTRAQLHFELRKGRKPIDPESVLVREPTAVASTQ